ncbi:MAG: glutaredoxin family protein [Acidobacteriota bacterium]
MYSRRDCHLCQEAYALLSRLRDEAPTNLSLEVVDVDASADLRQRYGHEVPVLLVNGKKFDKIRFNEPRLRRRLGL